jgi:2',3'-cyclic-nucleotide 2'-phosphodiesterase (5'-nucleotidase family)
LSDLTHRPDAGVDSWRADMLTRTRRATSIAATAAVAAGLVVLTAPADAAEPVFRLQLLHASDLEGGVDAIGRAPNFAAIIDKLEDDLDVDASLTVSAGDNVIPGPFYSAASDPSVQPTLNSVYNTLYGLAAPAPVYNDLRAGGGRIDFSIMNVVGFDASALGNHEFDLGSNELSINVRPDLRPLPPASPDGPPADRWVGVQFPYLSANLDFSADDALRTAFTTTLGSTDSYRNAPNGPAAPKIAPYAFYEQDGEKIGLVGATTPILQTISSPTGTTVIGPTTNDMPALAEILQPAIDAVVADGANKVVLLSHLQQIELETQLAGLLDGVDIIVAGGSDTILANPDDVLQPGAVAAGAYPRLTTSEAGEPVAIVSTDGEYTYVGRLVVDFDENGILVASDGTPLDDVTDLDLSLNGPIATTAEQVAVVWGADDPFAPGSKGQLVDQLTSSVTGVVADKDGNVVGETTVFLEGRRSEVRTQETNLGNLTSDANLFIARQVDPTVQVSIKNGGGIRAEIGEVTNDGDVTEFLPPQANPVSGKLDGQISQLDIENSLRFNNGLTLLTTTAAGLKELLEHGVAQTVPGATPGRFPQVGGMAFTFDATRTARVPATTTPTVTPGTPGERIRSLVVGDGPGADIVVADGQVVGDPTRPIRLVTLDFLANNGDGYPFDRFSPSRVDLRVAPVSTGNVTFAPDGSEQDALAEYLFQFHGIDDGTPFSIADTPQADDTRIQNLAVRADSLLTLGTAGNDVQPGTDGDDRLLGLGGNDLLIGLRGDDLLDGGDGNDLLIAGVGDDVLVGGAGNDTMIGGPGSDTFVVGLGTDVVIDFDRRTDTLDVDGAFASDSEFRAASRTVLGSTLIRLPNGGSVWVLGVRATQLVPGDNVTL